MDRKIGDRRPVVLVLERDPLLRWSLTTFLGRFFTVLAVESLEDGRRWVRSGFVDAVVASDDLAQEARILLGLIRKSNPAAIAIGMVVAASGGDVASDVVRIEKPFELPLLAALLWDNLPVGSGTDGV